MTPYLAFIDESGNHDLQTEKTGASKYFIVLAVITTESEYYDLCKKVDSIRLKFFGGNSEIKSNSVKDDRRLKIIDALSAIDFKCYAIVTNKEEIEKTSGLQYKKSFIKYCNHKLYSTLFRYFYGIEIFADGHGGDEFAKSFQAYISQKQTNLFADATLSIVDSKNSILVQLADFMVGTTAKFYENRTTEENKQKFINFVRSKCIRIDEWPHNLQRTTPLATFNEADERDEIVRNTASNQAVIFLRQFEDSSDDIISQQWLILNYLLFRSNFNETDDFVPTHDIVNHLHQHGFTKITDQYLRSNLIAKLRDSDVIIASSSRGYKIPTSFKDMLIFSELVQDHTIPLLNRLKKAQESIKLASSGKFDILSSSKFESIRKIIESNQF